jgi:MFS family permease
VERGAARPPWAALVVACGVLAFHNAMRIGPVTLVEELRARYGADYAGIGNVVGAYTLAYGFAQLGAGLLTDRLGSRRLMLVGLGLGAAASAVFALTEAYAVAVLARLRDLDRRRAAGVRSGPMPRPTAPSIERGAAGGRGSRR